MAFYQRLQFTMIAGRTVYVFYDLFEDTDECQQLIVELQVGGQRSTQPPVVQTTHVIR